MASLLAAAWAADPPTGLRLVANLRGVRGAGKSDREGFYAAALWLHARHPAALARNAASVAAFGYLKDLPEPLHRIVHGGRSTRTLGKKARLEAGSGGFVRRGGRGRGRLRSSSRRKPCREESPAPWHGGRARRGQPGAQPEARGRGCDVTPEQEGGCRGEGGGDVQARLGVSVPA